MDANMTYPVETGEFNLNIMGEELTYKRIDLMPFTLSFWPFFFGHCLLSLLLLSCQVSIMPRSNFNSSWNPKTIESVLKYTLSVSVFSYLMHQVLFGDCLLMLRLK